MTDIESLLEQYGLSNKETKIYLAAISLGTASITQISKKAGLKRPTTYLVIDELLKKHLIIAIPQGKRIYYKAENPEELLNKIDERKRKIEEVLPELRSLYNRNSRQPKVRFYEGKDSLNKVYEEVFRSKEIWGMFSPDKFSSVFSKEESEHQFKILTRAGGIIYDILENTKKAHEYAKANYRVGVSETRFLPKDFKLATDILVFGNKVAMISFENLIGVIIENEQIAQSQKQLLKFLWERIK